MRRMAGRGRKVAGTGVSLLSVAGVVLAASVVHGESIRRGAASFDAPSIVHSNLCAIDHTVSHDVHSLPPAGDGMIRPSHFAVCAVIVSVRHIWDVQCSRLGGLHGP